MPCSGLLFRPISAAGSETDRFHEKMLVSESVLFICSIAGLLEIAKIGRHFIANGPTYRLVHMRNSAHLMVTQVHKSK